jgi:hypothetical protein
MNNKKCDVCGKFRKDADIVCIEYGTELSGPQEQFECRYCVSESDRKSYFKENGEKNDKE